MLKVELHDKADAHFLKAPMNVRPLCYDRACSYIYLFTAPAYL